MHKQRGIVGLALVLVVVAVLIGGYFLWKLWKINRIDSRRSLNTANLIEKVGRVDSWQIYQGSFFKFRYPTYYFVSPGANPGTIDITDDPYIYTNKRTFNITDYSIIGSQDYESILAYAKKNTIGLEVTNVGNGVIFSTAKYGPYNSIFVKDGKTISLKLDDSYADNSPWSQDRILLEQIASTFEFSRPEARTSIFDRPDLIEYTDKVNSYTIKYSSHTFLRGECITEYRELTGDVVFTIRRKDKDAGDKDRFQDSTQHDCATLSPRDRPRAEDMYIFVADAPRDPPVTKDGYTEERGVWPTVNVLEERNIDIDGIQAKEYIVNESFFNFPPNWFREVLFERKGKHFWIRLEEESLQSEFEEVLSAFRFLD